MSLNVALGVFSFLVFSSARAFMEVVLERASEWGISVRALTARLADARRNLWGASVVSLASPACLLALLTARREVI